MDDVAARAGVSRALVSLVMRNSPKVSAGRREAVLAAAKELGYRPNAAARRLAERRSNTLGVVIHDLHNPFYADVVDGIWEQATGNGYRLLLNAAMGGEDEAEVRAVESFIEYQVDAVILVGTRLPGPTLAELASAATVVAVAADPGSVDTVANDDERGGALVAEHLIGLGHSKLAHIDGGNGGGAASRRGGFEKACARHGLTPTIIPGAYTEAAGRTGVEQLLQLQTLPTALFAANDLVAVSAIDRLEDAGLRVPDDISLVGYDNTALAALNHISLTTVNQPRVEMGRAAVVRAIERIENGGGAPLGQVLAPELVVRSTTGPASVDLHEVTARSDRSGTREPTPAADANQARVQARSSHD